MSAASAGSFYGCQTGKDRARGVLKSIEFSMDF
jgi:hypothetical protein